MLIWATLRLATLYLERKTAIIICFVNHKHKIELMMQGKKLKNTDVYLNEHLTTKNANIARQARQLRKNKKIQSTWTRNCKVFVKTNATATKAAEIIMVRELKALGAFR